MCCTMHPLWSRVHAHNTKLHESADIEVLYVYLILLKPEVRYDVPAVNYVE